MISWSTRVALAPRGAVCLLLVAAAAFPGCSIRKLAADRIGEALVSGASVYASDDDPELVGDALPFALKTIEGLLAASPKNDDLLLAASSGFAQYAYAYLQLEADYIEEVDLARATEMRTRALRLYRRALDYGLEGLEVRHPGISAGLRRDAASALSAGKKEDVPLLYWTAAAWGGAIALAKHDAELSADLPLVEAMMRRALQLDPGFGSGAIWDFFISYEGGRPAAGGGSIERAREAFENAVATSGGRRPAPYVSFAETVSVGTQDRAEFERLLETALVIDPDAVPEERLATLINQKRARWLLARADLLFLD